MHICSPPLNRKNTYLKLPPAENRDIQDSRKKAFTSVLVALTIFSGCALTNKSVENSRREDCTAEAQIEFSQLKIPKDNLLHKILSVERSGGKLNPYYADAYKNFNRLIETLTEKLKKTNSSIEGKILEAYKIMREEGFKLAEFQDEYSSEKNSAFNKLTLTFSLAKKQFDCDTSSAIISGLAQLLASTDPRWKELKIATFPGHVWLRYRGRNFDYGEKNPDSLYYPHIRTKNLFELEQTPEHEVFTSTSIWALRSFLRIDECQKTTGST